MKHPSYCCQKCGELIGWTGRFMFPFLHKCKKKEAKPCQEVQAVTDKEINQAIADYVNVFALYTTDLNAMHEAEKSLAHEQLATYSTFVGVLATSHLPMSRAVLMDFKMIHASARQRSEAFLRTVGKWKEAKP